MADTVTSLDIGVDRVYGYYWNELTDDKYQ